MPIEGSAGTLDIENATLRSNAIAVLTNLVTGNDVIRSSNPPALEVYGDPSHGGNEARLELVSNTATVSSSAFTRLTSNAGVLSVKTGTDASDNGTITFGGFANERMRIGSDGNVGIGTTDPVAAVDARIGDGVSPTGWVSGCFGSATGSVGRVVAGAYNSCPVIGGHNTDLTSWDKLVINPANQGNVGVGTFTPLRKLHIEPSMMVANNTTTSALLVDNSAQGAGVNDYVYILNAPRPGTNVGGAVHFINSSTRAADGGVSAYTIRNNSGSVDIGSRSETLVTSHNPTPETYNAEQKNVDIMLNNGSIWLSPYTGRHRDLGTGVGDWSQYIGKHYSGRILSGIQIENKSTNSAGSTSYYSNLLHFRAHDYGVYGGLVDDITMTVRGDKVGVRTQTPGYTLEVNGIVNCTSLSETSDDRIKYNEQDVSNALDIIGKLKPQKYEKIMSFPSEAKGTWIPTDENWETVKNAETKPWEGFTYGNEFGFIAQDVRNIPEISFLVSGSENKMSDENISPDEYHKLPEEEQSNYTQKFIYESNVITTQEYTSLTIENKEKCTELYSKRVETQTPLGLNYQGLFVIAIGAIKELKARNDALEARILALESV